MSGSAAASIEEFIELLNAEQHVDLPKLRDYARHGVQPTVRGEVWLYLLGVLSDDKSQEMTSVRSKYIEYDSLDKHNLLYEKRIRNEAVRYYQRRLIPRPPPGRTLARSSQRIAQQNSHSNSSGSMGVALASGMSAPLSTSVAKAATTMRGPNRVDNGQTHVLAGIMGDSSTGPTNLLHPSESDDVLLIDPQAAAANEMKRFCQAVENIVCAHLNRWTWCSIDGKVKIVEPRREEEPQDDSIDMGDSSQSFHSPDQTSHTAAQQHGQRPVSPGSDGLKSSPGSYLAPPEHITRARSSTASSSYSSASSIEESREQAGVASSSSPFPSLPKEYEWAHQIGEAPTSVVRMVDESEVEHHQGHFIQPEYHPDLILLCSPFVKCIRSEAGMFFAFERLMSIIDSYNVQHPLPSRISTFLTLFRTTLPELYAYFDEEEVDVIGLASAWLRHLLAAEMRIEDLMRLWVPDPLDLHMYVCIAILTHCKDALEELDQSEAKSMLFSLPPLDVDRVINEAINIRLSHRQSEMFTHVEDED